jgi:hypothetical protein
MTNTLAELRIIDRNQSSGMTGILLAARSQNPADARRAANEIDFGSQPHGELKPG